MKENSIQNVFPPHSPEGLSSAVLELLITVNQARPSTEGTVGVLKAAPKHLSPLLWSMIQLLGRSPPSQEGGRRIIAQTLSLIAL